MNTKIYQNTTEMDMTVIGIGLIPAGEMVSITSDFLPAVNLTNYPGLVDATDEIVTDQQTDNTQEDQSNG